MSHPDPNEPSAIQLACDAVGGQAVLVRRLRSHGVRVTAQAVHLWVKAGKVPPKRVLAVEAVTGMPKHRLRPDLYPPPVPTQEVAATC